MSILGKRARCTYLLEGPKIDGRGNVAWRRACKRTLIVPVETRWWDVRCWQHRSP